MKKILFAITIILATCISASAAEKNDTHFRFAVISDIHLDSKAWDDPGNFKLLKHSEDLLRIAISEVNSLNHDTDVENDIDFVLFPGDNINSRWSDDYKLLAEIISELEMPFYLIPGDWDYSVNCSPRLINEHFQVPHDNLNANVMFEQSSIPGMRKYDYSLDIRNAHGDYVHLVGIDPWNPIGSTIRMEKEQAKKQSHDRDISSRIQQSSLFSRHRFAVLVLLQMGTIPVQRILRHRDLF